MRAKDYYKTLGVPETASTDEIKKAYRKIAKKNHPDQNPGDTAAEERFKAASEAYAVLNDAEKRKRYDALRRYGFSDGSGMGGGFPGGFPGGIHFRTGPGGARTMEFDGDFGDLHVEDLFGRNSPFSDVFEQLFQQMGAAGAQRRAGPRMRARPRQQAAVDEFFRPDGLDVHCTVWLKLDQLERGAKVKVRTPDGKKALVRIPAGTSIGAVFRLRGLGLGGNGRRGDQFVHVEAVA